MSLENYKKISNLLEYIELDVAACDGFWNFLNDSEVTWGSEGTITLINSIYIRDLIMEFINNDPEDEDNPTYLNLIHRFFQNYDQQFLVID